MSGWRRRIGALTAALACFGLGVEARGIARSVALVAPPRRVLDDFETASSSRYGVLDRWFPERQRGRLKWRREACGPPSGSRGGHCMRLEYVFDSTTPSRVTFRIDLGDVDASRYDHLEFWVRGDPAIGYSPSLRVGFRRPKPGPRGLVEDGTTVVSGIGPEWRHVVVPLGRLPGIRDWRHLQAFFLALDSRRAGADRRGAYEIDDVALLDTGARGPTVWDEVVPRKKLDWQRSVGGVEVARRLIRARLAGWPRHLLVRRAELPRSDREFLETVARDTWEGVVAFSDRQNGLPVDHVVLSGDPPDDRSRVADYTNITNVGLHLLATVAANELGLVSRERAIRRIELVLETLRRLETYQGFFFNYYDTTTLERTSNLVSFVDSSWLTAGLMVVRTAFPALRARCNRLIDAQNYGFFYDEVAEQMSHGYYVNVPTRSEYHYGALYTEARLGSFIAIGKGEVPESHWFALVRTYPPEMDWQTMHPRGVHDKVVRGHVVHGGYYQWRHQKFVPSWGGSMFEALMPALVLDERKYAPRSLGRNDETHARVQREYASAVLRYPVWGLSPSAEPLDGGYGEYGVKILGTLGYPPGAVAPYAAALALAVIPDAATADLRRIAERYDTYGPYGFYDAFDPESGAVAHRYLALDQAMTVVALANALKGGCIQKHFAADPIARRALPVIAAEDFFD